MLVITFGCCGTCFYQFSAMDYHRSDGYDQPAPTQVPTTDSTPVRIHPAEPAKPKAPIKKKVDKPAKGLSDG